MPEGPVCVVPEIGFRPELLSPVQLNRTSSGTIEVSRNSAFTHYQCRSITPGGLLEKSQSVIFKKESEPVLKNLTKMDSFHELHVDIPINEYMNSAPNSSSITITPSPRPDLIPEAEFSTQIHSSKPPAPFIEFINPVQTTHNKIEPEKSKHFKQILNLFQNAVDIRRQQTDGRSQSNRRFNRLRNRFDSLSLDESSGSDSSLHTVPVYQRMPRTTISTASKSQTRTLITEHLSEEEDRGIVKDIIFQDNQPRIPIEHRNPPMIKSPGSILSVDVKEPKLISRLGNSLTVSMYSPQSNKVSPTGSVRSRISDGFFHQIATAHSSTLAYVSENFPKLLREFSPVATVGREIFDNACLSNIVFKSTAPVFIKDKIALFDAAFIASNYTEYPITVMISPAGQYAPLLGRHAERSGFGPPVLAEFEELEIELRHFLNESSYDQKPVTTLKIVVMPPTNVCSLQSLAAHYLNKNLNANKSEEQICFVMLQLLGALKCLQSDGIEQLSNNFKEFILSYANPDGKNSLLQTMDQLPRLMFLKDMIDEYNDDQLSIATELGEDNQQQTSTVGLCKFALRALCILLNRKFQGTLPEIPERTRFSTPLRLVAQLLNRDRSNSMSEARQILEYTFFVVGQSFENEYEAKLYLDDKRAMFVSQLVRWLIQRDAQLTSPKQQAYLLFLLSSTPRGIFNTCQHLKRK